MEGKIDNLLTQINVLNALTLITSLIIVKIN